MLKDLVKKYYIDQSYNCAESVVLAANEYYGLGLESKDIHLMSGYGGGMMCGSTCGGLLGALAVISYTLVETNAHDAKDLRPAANELTSKFQEAFKSFNCAEIKPVPFDPAVRCLSLLEYTCDVVEKILADYGKNA